MKTWVSASMFLSTYFLRSLFMLYVYPGFYCWEELYSSFLWSIMYKQEEFYLWVPHSFECTPSGWGICVYFRSFTAASVVWNLVYVGHERTVRAFLLALNPHELISLALLRCTNVFFRYFVVDILPFWNGAEWNRSRRLPILEKTQQMFRLWEKVDSFSSFTSGWDFSVDPRTTEAYLTGRREPRCRSSGWKTSLSSKGLNVFNVWKTETTSHLLNGGDLNNWSFFFYSKKKRSLLIKLALWGKTRLLVQGWN